MKRLLIMIAFAFFSAQLYAQKAFKYYLNNREISGYSLSYFEPSDFDSIKFFSGLEAKRLFELKTANVDSVCIAYKKETSGFTFYNELCDSYHLSKKGRKLGLGIPDQSAKDLALMIFDKKLVTGVHMSMFRNNKFTPKTVVIEMHGLYNVVYKRDLVMKFNQIIYNHKLNRL
ncbi:MAG: hypothetical protein JWR50_3219 [Mucilaginibacter sp.]|nr:hypothetical protein [Mucilaginibacter sp.]